MDWIWPGGLMALLTLCLLFVNGWTDAPNAIAACVATRCLPLRQAVWMSAACNGVGLLLSVRFGGAVAATIRDMVSLDGQQGNAALCAAMAAVILWAVAAWYFGIPTSESHGLIAGLTGAALALGGGLEGICTAAWIRVLWGLAASVAVGALAGFGAAR